MGIRKVRTQFKSADIFRDGLGILLLFRAQIAQLQVRLRERRLEFNRSLQQRLDLMEIQAGILSPPSLPQAHRVVIRGPSVARLKPRKAAESFDDLLGLAWRTVVGLEEK